MKKPASIDLEMIFSATQRLVYTSFADIDRLGWGLMDVKAHVARSEEAIATSRVLLSQLERRMPIAKGERAHFNS